MDEESIQEFLKYVSELLHDPTVSVDIERGIRRRDNFLKGIVEAEPTKGITVVIKVYGGAKDEIAPPLKRSI